MTIVCTAYSTLNYLCVITSC